MRLCVYIWITTPFPALSHVRARDGRDTTRAHKAVHLGKSAATVVHAFDAGGNDVVIILQRNLRIYLFCA